MGHTETHPSPTTTQATLYAKSAHGGHAVQIVPQGFQVDWPNGPVTYPSRRQLIHALYDEGRDPGVSFDRYFRLGRWATQPKSPVATTLDLFGQGEGATRTQDIPVLRRPRIACAPRTRLKSVPANTLALFEQKHADLIVQPVRAKATRKQRALTVSTEEPTLGINLTQRGHEVRKLLFAGFGSKMARGGYDPDDVLQEVYRGLLARNKGKCPFDVRKSSFGHYVHMVCGCVLANYHRKESRRGEFEQVGFPNMLEDSKSRDMDAALKATDDASLPLHGNMDGPEEEIGAVRAIQSLQSFIGDDTGRAPLKGAACKIVPLVYQGYTRKEIALELGMSPAKVTQVLLYLRSQATRWKTSE